MSGIPLFRQNPSTLDWEVVSSYESDDCENRSDDGAFASSGPNGGALMLHTQGLHDIKFDRHTGDARFAPGEPGGFMISCLSPVPPPGALVPVHIVTVPSIETYQKMQENPHGRRSPHADMGPVSQSERHSPLLPPPPPPHLHVPRASPVPPPPPPLPSHTERYPSPTRYSPIPDETGYPSRTGHLHDADHHRDAHSYYTSEERSYHIHSSRYSYQATAWACDRPASGSRSRSRSRSPMRCSPGGGLSGEYARSSYWP
ncbi:hypothetical protein SCLCIDRAFT_6264 [Scleroderma citrinum Foug A]|uniref:Uncharacterized protein n=1 Tax=Scleroderma citrinum Foug A TaxID=1036808 RepID=A0A0C3B0A3_9AGAM|nr:hypothetical protein SCLCIDRAFT_6264 [Scleroderma citrinum Foug A]